VPVEARFNAAIVLQIAFFKRDVFLQLQGRYLRGLANSNPAICSVIFMYRFLWLVIVRSAPLKLIDILALYI